MASRPRTQLGDPTPATGDPHAPRSHLTRGDVSYRQGIRVTTIARTISDIARRLTDDELTRAIHEARRNRDHSLPDRFEADRERDELAITLQHATLRITWRRLTRKPGELDRNLRVILAARAPRVIRHGDRDA